MKVFATGACRHAYVATMCTIGLSYAESTNLFSKNYRTYEIWGLKIASEAISQHLTDPLRYYIHADVRLGHTTLKQLAMALPCNPPNSL